MDFDLSELNSNYAPTAPAKPLAEASQRLRKGAKTKRKVRVNPKTIEAGKAALDRSRPTTITLRQRFTINSAPVTKVRRNHAGKLVYEDVPGTGGNTTYGPGSVTVPKAVAQVLLEMQRNAEQVAATESVARATVVLDERRTLSVADESQLNAFLGMGPVSQAFRF